MVIIDPISPYLYWILVVLLWYGILELAFPIAVNQVIDKIMPQNNFRIILLACIGLLLFYIINTVLQYIVVFFSIN